MYATIDPKKNKIIEYPVYLADKHPNISFTGDWEGGPINCSLTRKKFNYIKVKEVPQPTITDEYIVVETQPQEIDGIWTQTWQVVLKSKEERKKLVKRIAEEKERAGISLFGVKFATDIDSQNKYQTALTHFNIDPSLTEINWEASHGVFIVLDKSKLTELIITVRKYVQSIYDVKKYIMQKIDNEKEVDIYAGWP